MQLVVKGMVIKMKDKPHIRLLLNQIETFLYDELNIEKITAACFVSSSQLYRDFYNITGHTVKEYIRKRRLSNALAMVKHSDMSLTQIAYECGYSSQQAFCKCVKSATSQTPLEYKMGDSYYYFPMFSHESTRQISVESDTLPETVRLSYYSTKLAGIEINAVNLLLTLLGDTKTRIFGTNGRQGVKGFCYEILVENKPDVIKKLRGSKFIVRNTEPSFSCNFAKTIVKNSEHEISEAWDYLYNDWQGKSMFRKSDKLSYFEEYIIKKGEINRLMLYLPVERRKDYNKIIVSNYEERLFIVAENDGLNAEEDASNEIMEFLKKYYPSVLKNTTQFFSSRTNGSYSCGVEINKDLVLPKNYNVRILRLPAGKYAVLEGFVGGCISVYSSILSSWIDNSKLLRDEYPPFVIYDTNENNSAEKIRVRIYIKIKNEKNG